MRFYEINDIALNRKKMMSFVGEMKRTIKDWPYTHEEIRKLLDKCGERKRVGPNPCKHRNEGGSPA